ncbi:hypothetical protein Ahy_A03g011466 [Arachis hypogaea]|uniref:Uncharacterized protein n=1 Tax=Arachis hypogaea TaxID=3818 RepID=A0A445DQS9_ARAHY|nr:hypothetical protein Ahy_A03g011466 [Arachis hypogaea]
MKNSSSSSSINTQILEIQAMFKIKKALKKSSKILTFLFLISKSKYYTVFRSDITVLMKLFKSFTQFYQTKDLMCATRLLSEKFEKMSELKKAIVRDLFSDKVSYKNLSEENQLIFRRFQGNTLKQLTNEMMSINVESEQDRLMFKRIFIFYIQMAFLLPSTITKVSPVHIAPIFEMEKITEGNWGAHVLNFIIKCIKNYRLKKKKSIDGCLYTLMIIYFHLAKTNEKKREKKTAVPWVSNWNREQLVVRIRAEIDGHMTDVDVSSESESEEDSEKPTKKQPKRGAKKVKSRKRKQILEDFSSKSKRESTDESEEYLPIKKTKNKQKKFTLPQKSMNCLRQYLIINIVDAIQKKKHVIEDSSSEEENYSYDWFSREEESLIPIQLCLPSSKATSETPVPPFEPFPPTESTLKPQKVDESTPTMPPAPSKMDPAPEATAAALLMMARTVSYVPKELSLPSFSIGLTDSSQEETQTQEGVGQAEA